MNGTSFSDLPLDVKDDLRTDPLEDRDNTLIIPAKAVYNGTTVQCVTGDYGIDGVVVESENATLIIQGIHAINDMTCTCITIQCKAIYTYWP